MQPLPPTVCLDGSAVRRIREEKRLTQLYVAKVVGVTVDTISRWENNRYPTVRRENLLKLGEALEALPEELLRRDDDEAAIVAEAAEAAAEPPVPAARRWPLWAGLLLIAGVFAGFWLPGRTPAPLPPAAVAPTVERVLPRYAAPGTVIPVRLRLKLDSSTVASGAIVRERFPAGWELIEAFPPASSIDNEDGMARWILKPGDSQALIVYLVRADARSPLGMVGRFRGELIAGSGGRGEAVSAAGDSSVEVAGRIWADSDGDGRVDDNEMLAASQAVEEMDNVHLDWKGLEKLWDAGAYRFDAANRRFVPLRDAH